MNGRFLAGFALYACAATAQDFSKVEIKTIKLGDTAYMMEGAGGNLGVSIGEDAVFLVATVSARIRKMVADGRKLEDITASDASADFDEKWGKGFIAAAKFREMVAMNILKNR